MHIGAWGPNWIGLPVGVHLSSVQLNDGIGPLVDPSHSSHPIAQPLENQKHAAHSFINNPTCGGGGTLAVGASQVAVIVAGCLVAREGAPETRNKEAPWFKMCGGGCGGGWHQGSKGSGCGTSPPHGLASESIAFLGRGIVIALCATTIAGRKQRRSTTKGEAAIVQIACRLSAQACITALRSFVLAWGGH